MNDHDRQDETPAERAKRIGVPLIPGRPTRAPIDSNPIVGVCGVCGCEVRRMMWLSCRLDGCPVTPTVSFGESTLPCRPARPDLPKMFDYSEPK